MLVLTDPLQDIICHVEQAAIPGCAGVAVEAMESELAFFCVEDLEQAVSEKEEPVSCLQGKRVADPPSLRVWTGPSTPLGAHTSDPMWPTGCTRQPPPSG